MVLIKCPECGQDVSTYAEICPHCGYPLQKSKPTEEAKQIVNEDVVVAKMKGGGSFAGSIVAFALMFVLGQLLFTTTALPSSVCDQPAFLLG